MPNAAQILKQYWGYNAFRPLQEEIIQSVLKGNDTLALLPTGGGKSICFQVPALAMDGLCIVISPLIALMRDQVNNLNQKGIKAAALYTGLSLKQMDAILDSCIYSNTKFLYISPERLNMEDFRVRLAKMKVALLAVDEAHCISQWGYDFRPSYLKIAEIRTQLKNVPVIALTATATPEVIEDIQDKLNFSKRNVLRKSFVRKNLSYVVRKTTNKNKSLLEMLNKVKGSAVLYVRSRKKTKEYSDYLVKHGISSDYYHAGLEPNERNKKQDMWLKNKTRIICCTNAFGMGIDKPDVRLVVHMDTTESLEAYFQEAGRAGRDEQKAWAVQLINSSDILDLDEKISNGFPTIGFIKTVYESLCRYFMIAFHSGVGQSFDFDLREFNQNYNLDGLKTLAALKILEQQEIITLSDGVRTLSQVKAIANKDVLFKFQSDNAKLEPLIKFILRTSEGVFEDFVAIEEEAMALRLKISTGDVVEQLKALDKFRIFSYQPRKDKPQVYFLQNRVPKENFRLDNAFIEKRKANYEQKLKAVKGYLTDETVCRTRLLVKYFGETLDHDCGICDVCVERKKTTTSASDFSKIASQLENELKLSALGYDEIKNRLGIGAAELNQTIEFLLDTGKIKRTPQSTFKWVE